MASLLSSSTPKCWGLTPGSNSTLEGNWQSSTWWEEMPRMKLTRVFILDLLWSTLTIISGWPSQTTFEGSPAAHECIPDRTRQRNMDQLRPTHPRWSLQTQDSEDLEDTDDLGSENSSELSSGPPSPIFDGPEEDGRRVLRRQKSASTISSITSSTPALPASQSEPRLCVLDART